MRVYLAATLAAVLWGTSFPLSKIAVQEVGAMTTAAARWWIGGLVLVGMLSLTAESRRALWRAWRADWRAFTGLGVLGVGIYFVLQNAALNYTTSVDVGLIMNVFPVVTAVLGVWLLGEEFKRRAIAGLLVASAGVVFISLGGMQAGASAQASAPLLGNLLALGAALVGGAYLALGKRALGGYSPLNVTALTGLVGAAMLTPCAAWEQGNLNVSLPVWAAVLGLALGSSVLAYWLYWHAAQRMPISKVGVFLYVTPLVSTVLGVAVLGEPLTVATSVGAGLVLGGVTLVQS